MFQAGGFGFLQDFHKIGQGVILRIDDAVPFEVGGMQGQSGILRRLDHRIAVRETIHFTLFVPRGRHAFERRDRISLDGFTQGVKLEADVFAVSVIGLQGK